jgi:hypothetical protein
MLFQVFQNWVHAKWLRREKEKPVFLYREHGLF